MDELDLVRSVCCCCCGRRRTNSSKQKHTLNLNRYFFPTADLSKVGRAAENREILKTIFYFKDVVTLFCKIKITRFRSNNKKMTGGSFLPPCLGLRWFIESCLFVVGGGPVLISKKKRWRHGSRASDGSLSRSESRHNHELTPKRVVRPVSDVTIRFFIASWKPWKSKLMIGHQCLAKRCCCLATKPRDF